jgi:hemin uptake protein HemP
MKNDTQAAPALALRSEALFAGRQMIVIEHAGKRYQLRLISANKLLLTA